MAELFFNYKANSSDPNWEVLNYLNKLELEESRNKILESVFCFWYALAVGKEGNDWSLAVREGNSNIYQLERRISSLEQEFEIRENLGNTRFFKKITYLEGRSSVNFEFRYQTRGEGEGTDWLFRYLRSKDTSFTIEQKILWALDAYWGAIAYREFELNEEKIIAKAISCWNYLRKHKKFLEGTFLGCTTAYPQFRRFNLEDEPYLVRNRTVTLSDANEERILEREIDINSDVPRSDVNAGRNLEKEIDINSDEFIKSMIDHPMNSVLDEFNKQNVKNSF
ncbi:hypothetical protein C7H19_15195 [Aphanothece hegewaldii CCALA 016]|uniref:Uncharacterized protein n=1 Tax=Aphanothece hegewaldii CCALA 016 TaxID=2107694 RepID=A0A2T1LVL2_9CHRO|nr:hypothetical protein [Aphanothece hegewaldii]PSF35769.1 hypothetical protein C7H19_15195 [Aphanothece hegewaldii CCALA 016]